MNKIIIDYGKSGKNYYYKDNQLYTEAGELVPKGEALELHFRETGRTPLVTGSYTQPLVTFKEDRQIDETKFSLFHLFLDQLSAEEQEHQIRLAIKRIRKHIIFLPQTGLGGDTRDEVELIYERQIEALEQRLQGKGEKDWEPLYQDLINEYIADVSSHDFSQVMEGKRLPDGKDRILWRGDDARCALFVPVFGFSFPQLNACFRNAKGRKFILSDIPKPYRKVPDENAKNANPQLRKYYAMLEKHKRQ